MELPSHISKRKTKATRIDLNLSTTIGVLKEQLEDFPDDTIIEEDWDPYTGGLTYYYVTVNSEESDEDYYRRILNYVKRKEQSQK